MDREQRKEVVEERRVSESEGASAPAGVNICFRNLNNRPPVICISDNGQPYGFVDPRCAEVLLLSPYPSLSFICQHPSNFFHLFFLLSPSFYCTLSLTYYLFGHILFFYKHPSSLSVLHESLDMTHPTELWPKLPWQQRQGCPLFVQNCFQQVTGNSDAACLLMMEDRYRDQKGCGNVCLKSCSCLVL